jgi:glutamyl-tRNA synthetase
MNRIEGLTAEKLRDGVKIETDQQRAAYTLALQQFDALIEWNKEGVDAALRKTADRARDQAEGHDPRLLSRGIGRPQGVPLFDAITHLGRDILRERLRHAMELLGPASKKEAEAWTALSKAAVIE